LYMLPVPFEAGVYKHGKTVNCQQRPTDIVDRVDWLLAPLES